MRGNYAGSIQAVENRHLLESEICAVCVGIDALKSVLSAEKVFFTPTIFLFEFSKMAIFGVMAYLAAMTNGKKHISVTSNNNGLMFLNCSKWRIRIYRVAVWVSAKMLFRNIIKAPV